MQISFKPSNKKIIFLLVIIFVLGGYIKLTKYYQQQREDNLSLITKINLILENNLNLTLNKLIDQPCQHFCVLYPFSQKVRNNFVNYSPLKQMPDSDKEKLLDEVSRPFSSQFEHNRWLVILDKNARLIKIFQIGYWYIDRSDKLNNIGFYCGNGNENIKTLFKNIRFLSKLKFKKKDAEASFLIYSHSIVAGGLDDTS